MGYFVEICQMIALSLFVAFAVAEDIVGNRLEGAALYTGFGGVGPGMRSV